MTIYHRFWISLISLVLLLIPALWGIRAYADPLPEARIVIHIPSRTLLLYSGDTLVRRYPVGVGKVNFPTPEGAFQVTRKVEDPGWENPFKPSGRRRIAPGPKNPLGTRWIGFLDVPEGEYGIHGTPDPGSVGQFSSHGCVRMHIKDAEELYDFVVVGTPVEVNYESAWIDREGDEVKVTVYPNWFGKGTLSLEALKQMILARFPTARLDESRLSMLIEHVLAAPTAIAKVDPDAPETFTFKLRISN